MHSNNFEGSELPRGINWFECVHYWACIPEQHANLRFDPKRLGKYYKFWNMKFEIFQINLNIENILYKYLKVRNDIRFKIGKCSRIWALI